MCDSFFYDFMFILILCINEELTIVLILFFIDFFFIDWLDYVRFYFLKRFI